MVRNRVISFPRQIIVCLTLSLIIFLFALSCQKDEGIKQKDPNALTKAQAKEYFEQNARTLKFLTTGQTPAGTKNLDYSLTENMIIEWEQAIEGENADSYLVEVPIRMDSPVTAILYDGLGHINKNIRQVFVITSLLIEKQKNNGCVHYLVVTTVGTFSKSVDNSIYGYLCDKNSFWGYQFFSNEEGNITSSLFIDKGSFVSRQLVTEAHTPKVDGLGRDLKFKGISFFLSKGALTKGGGNSSTGEDNICPACGNIVVFWGNENGINYYYCPTCCSFVYEFIDPSVNYCAVCGYPTSSCQCCPDCLQYPCGCNQHPGDPFPPYRCSLCGREVCDGLCQTNQPDYGNNPSPFHLVTVNVDPATPYGYVSKTPSGNYNGIGVEVTIEATAYTGYHFVGWKRSGCSDFFSTSNPLSFISLFDQIIYAVFAID